MSAKQRVRKLAANERNDWRLPFVFGVEMPKPIVTKFDDVAWTKELLARPVGEREVKS